MTVRTSERPAASDVALALGFAALSTAMTVSYLGLPQGAPTKWFLYALAAGTPLLLVWRRKAPVVVFGAMVVLVVAHFVAGEWSLPSDLALFVALYSVAVRRPFVDSVIALVVTDLLMVLAMTTPDLMSPEFLIALAIWTALTFAPWSLGRQARTRAEQVRLLEENTARLETERAQLAQLATSNERNRIAREMHDIIAHSLSVMIAQADGGRYAVLADPAAGQRALETIADVGRASLADMRRLLGVLREPDTPTSTTVPQPIDADLDELVGNVRAAGLRVSLVRMGTARPLPPGAGLTVYRIVQEALTNAMKHAGPNAKVTVMIQWLRSALALEISDDGRGAAAPSDGKGQGLIGMQERAAIFGGTVSAGPRPGGGFQVKILIPLPEDRVRPTHESGEVE